MILPNEIIDLILLYTNDIILNIKLKRNYNVKQMVKKYTNNCNTFRNYNMERILNYCIKYKNKELTEYFFEYYYYYTHGVTIYKVGNLELLKRLKEVNIHCCEINEVLKSLCKKGYVKMLDYIITNKLIKESYIYQYQSDLSQSKLLLAKDQVLNRKRNVDIYYDIAVKFKRKQMIKYLQNKIDKILFI
jgi:hypothetical protein